MEKFRIPRALASVPTSLRKDGMSDSTVEMDAAKSYSRKPGFTETRFRPLARRRESTFWPPWVFMRVRKPCFLTRLRRLGWNVRLGMKNSCS
jgi:hypothetical protein